MPSPLLKKACLAGIVSIPFILLSIHVVAKAVFTLKQYDHRLDNDIRLLLAISRRHIYSWRSAGRQSLDQQIIAMATEKCRLRSKVGTGPRVSWGYNYRTIYSLIKEDWTGRAIRKSHEERFRDAMASRRLDLWSWRDWGLFEKDGDEHGAWISVDDRHTSVLVVSGTIEEEIHLPGDSAAAEESETDIIDEMDQAEADRDDLSWRLSEGPLDPDHYPYFRFLNEEICKNETPSVEL